MFEVIEYGHILIQFFGDRLFKLLFCSLIVFDKWNASNDLTFLDIQNLEAIVQ